MKPCKTCGDRWKEILIKQQLNQNTMKNSKEEKDETAAVAVTEAISKKPNIEKIIEDRRKSVSEGKQVNK